MIPTDLMEGYRRFRSGRYAEEEHRYRELAGGLAEVVKTALIGDPVLYDRLERDLVTAALRAAAQLALLGVETRVSEARLDTGLRYLVIAGPYLGRSALDKVRSLLRQNGHQGLLVRVVR